MDTRVVVLGLGSEEYAISTERVSQVIAAPRVTPVPTAPPAVLGVFNLRGEVVPLLDLPRLLGLGSAAGNAMPFAVVVETPRGRAGLTVEGLPHFGALGPEVGTSERPGVTSIHSIGDALVSLLDADALLDPVRLGPG
ncbi:MAG: chemotaxis protein CheW [Actinomycetota bacterium]